MALVADLFVALRKHTFVYGADCACEVCLLIAPALVGGALPTLAQRAFTARARALVAPSDALAQRTETARARQSPPIWPFVTVWQCGDVGGSS